MLDYWISMDFLIQTAWYSIELHGHAMAFHGTPSVPQGTPWWHSMELHDIYSLEFHGPLRKSHEISWHSMELHQYFMELHGIPWNPMDTPWNSKAFGGTPWILYPWKFHGIPSISIDFRGIPWISIDVHGFPWNSIPWRSFTRDTANKQPRLRFHVRNRPCMCRQQWSK